VPNQTALEGGLPILSSAVEIEELAVEEKISSHVMTDGLHPIRLFYIFHLMGCLTPGV
jgi:hypothetical protein